MGYFRGHKIVFENNIWVYEDTRTPIPSFGGEIRPCNKCGKLFSIDSYDPCIGFVPGADNVCCGHGIDSQSYITFKGGRFK